MSLQFQPEQVVRIRQPSSQIHAKRLRNFKQTFALFGVTITPCCPTYELFQHFGASFRTRVTSEVVPQVFHQLKALKLAKMFNGL